MEINNDGSMVVRTFSDDKYTGDRPRPIRGETYRRYHERVREAIEKGFHLGDLSWSDYQTYCMGSGQYDGFDSDNTIK